MTCDGNCNYRRLYEGSQASLSDLASKQAAALKRAGKLREEILSLMRQYFSQEYAQAELKLGQQLTRLDDDLMLAYVHSFLAAAATGKQQPQTPTVTESAELTELRQLAASKGVTIPENSDAQTWLKLLGPLAASELASQTQVVYDEVSSAELTGLFDDVPEAYADDHLSALFDDLGGGYASEGDLTDPDSIEDLDDLFSDSADALASPDDNVSAPPANEHSALPSDPDTAKAGSSGEPDSAEAGSTSGFSADSSRAGTPEGDAALAGSPGEEQKETQESPSPAAQEAASPAGQPAKGSQLGLAPNMNPVRPEIVPEPARPAKKKATKKTRVTATPPAEAGDSETFSPQHRASSSLEKMLSVVSSEPIFAADLTSAGVSSTELENFETSVQQEGTASSYRIVKGRDRKRLFLVVPAQAEGDSPWAQCLRSKDLRGNALYDAGIVVKSNSSSITQAEVHKNLVIFTTDDNTALVLLTNVDLAEGSPLSRQLLEFMPRLVSGDFNSVVLLAMTSKVEAYRRISSWVLKNAELQAWDVKSVVTVGNGRSFTGLGSSTVTHILP